MTFFRKVKDSLADRAAEGIAASLTVLLAWAAYQLAPVVLPAIESALSKQALLAILVVSLVLNVVFFIVAWLTTKSASAFRLKYGIYWDKGKNPHCPSCKTPLAAYGNYKYSGLGYFCTPCKKVFKLADASGNNVEPARAITEL